MIEYRVTSESVNLHIEAPDLAQVCAESVMLISTVYKRLKGDDAKAYKTAITENIALAFASDSEIDARAKAKGKQLLDRLNAAIEAMEKAMDTNAN